MKIQFCDLCNESVPQSDLEQGLAVLRKGRVVCRRCDAAMGASGAGHETSIAVGPSDTALAPSSAVAETQAGGVRSSRPAAPVAEGGGGMVVGFLAAVAVVLVAVVAVMLVDRIDSLGDDMEGRMGGLAQEVNGSEKALLARLEGVREATLVGTGAVDQRLAVLKERQEGDVRDLRARLDELVEEVDALRERLGTMVLVEREVAEHGRGLAQVEAGLNGLQLQLAGLAQDLAERPEEPVAPAPDEEVEPAWTGLLEGLSSDNSGVRWNTVEDLGRTGDPAVVVHLVPVLDDEDSFVRMAAARVLGDLQSMTAVGPLIDTLSDPVPSVRDAAVASLRLITGQNFRFDPLAKESERSKRIRAWRDWWAAQATPGA